MKTIQLYHFFEGVVPSEVCGLIMAEGDRLETGQATVFSDGGYGVVDEMRKTDVAFWDPWHWINGIMTHYIAMTNRQIWRYDVEVSQGVQYGVYGPGQFYDWHTDAYTKPIEDNSIPGETRQMNRVVSATLTLSDPDSYQGGDFAVRDGNGKEYVISGARTQGSVVVFPSIVSHRVAPVTRGVRKSCVSWILGPHNQA